MRISRRGLSRLPPARLTAAGLPFMLPTLVDELPSGPGWLFELKWDGVRVLALREAGRVELWSRSGRRVGMQYPEVTAGIAPLPGEALALDAEIVALDEQGRPSFERLQRRMHVTRGIEAVARAVPVTAYVYDCLVLSGRDLRGLPLVERKALLREVVPRRGGIHYCDHVAGRGRAFLDAACAAGLEGVVAKRGDSPYRGGRRMEWRKIKCQRRQEFVIGGYTAPQGTRAYLGAVHLGVYEDGVLVYVGRAGSGLDTAGLRDLHARLAPLTVARCPFTRGSPPRGPAHHWVRPELVCEVRFSEWTGEGRIRHPVFLGLRPDKRPREVRREAPTPTPRS